eukprot:scaffold22740_cov66-Phaeocystis_antarctica.AAC.1
MISPQLLPHRRRQKRSQLAAGAAEVHGAARLERVAQLAEDDALLVTAQLRQRHGGARAVGNARAARGDNCGQRIRAVERARGLVHIALRSPAPERPSDVNRYSPDIHNTQPTVAPDPGPSRRSLAICQCRLHSFLGCGAGRDGIKGNHLERRQHAAVERGGEGGAPGVGDPGVVE